MDDAATTLGCFADPRLVNALHDVTNAWRQLSLLLRETGPLADRAIDLVATARLLIAARGVRARHLDVALFGEPAWDMLLDLYAGKQEGVTVSSLCIAARVPATTALRHIAALKRRGLIVRKGDRSDRRRISLRLSDLGRMPLEASLDAIRALILVVVNEANFSAVVQPSMAG